MEALIHREGEFRRAEIAALDADTLAMAIALMGRARLGFSEVVVRIGLDGR